jgi:UDP-2,4-diacetamido-2,4,6-trideoxy-beta-L-altropyranose hydrolase
MKRGILLVRADATVASGTGHVMRCLALAQAWQHAGGDVIFAMAQSTAAIVGRLQAEQIKIIAIDADPGSAGDIQKTITLTKVHKPEWLLVDSYHFDAHYVSELQNVRPVLHLDDDGKTEFYSAEFVLNQNLHASAEMYARRAPHTRLLLGPRYSLLRTEFMAYQNWTRTIPDRGTRVLLTMGGSDPKNLTPSILSALSGLSVGDLRIRVIVGGSARNRSEVAEIGEKFPVRVELMSNIANMAELMAWADLAIAGAGTTCWEMCLMGLPAMLVIVAENQMFIAEHLEAVGAAITVGRAESLNSSLVAQIAGQLLDDGPRRLKMSQSGRQLVDGAGRERVRATLLDRELKLRLVRENDCQLLFEWANDPAARMASFHSKCISWEDHVDWFSDRLRDPNSVIYIGENAAGKAVGLVRFKIRGPSAVLSVNVAPEVRGQGWGKELIAFSTRSLFRVGSVRRIEAFVRPDNKASVRLFEASGFRRCGVEKVADQDALLFMWECVN